MWHKLSPLASHFELRVSVYGLLEHIQSFEIWGEILSSNRCNMLLCLATFTSHVCMATELKSLDTSRFWETRICLVYNLTWRSMARATSLMVLAKWWKFWTPRMIHYGKCMLIARSAPLGWLAASSFPLSIPPSESKASTMRISTASTSSCDQLRVKSRSPRRQKNVSAVSR